MTAKPRRGLLAAVAVAALGVMGAIAPAAAQEWRGWNIHAADYPNGVGMDAFARAVGERTNNRIRMVPTDPDTGPVERRKACHCRAGRRRQCH